MIIHLVISDRFRQESDITIETGTTMTRRKLSQIIIITSRVRPPNGGRNEANSSRHVVGCHLANNSIKSPTEHAIRKCAFFPPIAGERVGGSGLGVEMGTYWRPTVPNPHASPKVRCAVSEI